MPDELQDSARPWRIGHVATATDELLAYVRTTYAPLAVVVSGSIVRGEGDPSSDLDVVIVHAEPWRVREQRRFAGVPAELFVNPPAQIRRYFAEEHADGRPCTAHMIATGDVLVGHAIADELVREARDYLARPVGISDTALQARRYGIVDALDDARDVLDRDPAAAALLIAGAVRDLVEYAFWQQRRFQPRRKAAVASLAAIDAKAAALVRRWQTSPLETAAEAACELARHLLGTDTFFAWVSERDPVPVEAPDGQASP